jgi:predicted RNA-binding protein with PIN domain
MIILIDAYNMLKQLEGAQYISEAQHRAFVDTIAQYAQHKKHTILVIFDGGFAQRASIERISCRVSSVHVGYRQSADAYIVDYIQKYKGKSLLLVTADRQLIDHAAEHGFAAIDGDLFWHIASGVIREYQHAITKQSNRLVKTGQSSAEIDSLMVASFQQEIVDQKEEFTQKQRAGKMKTMSKKDRLILEYLKKLQ